MTPTPQFLARSWERVRSTAIAVLFLLFFLVILFAGCTSEGGVVGSGISALQGNVVDVQVEAAADDGSAAASNVESVLVSIDGTSLETVTDAQGDFSLSGDFAGSVSVRFRREVDGSLLGTYPVDVPSGSTVYLSNVELRADLDESVMVGDPLQFNLAGKVTAVDCAAMSIEVRDDGRMGRGFTLHLSESSELVDSDGNAVDCAAIVSGIHVLLEEGVIDTVDGSINAARLVIDGAAPPRRPREIDIRRRGVVLRVECKRAQVVHFQDSELHDIVRVELSAATTLRCTGEQTRACACEDIGFGDRIDVRGLRRLTRPGTIVALDVSVTPTAAQTVRRVLTGDVRRIDCAAGSATIVDVRLADAGLGERPPDLAALPVILTADTVYRCSAGAPGDCRGDGAGCFAARIPCRCEDIGERYRVAIDAMIPIAAGRVPEVLNLSVLAVPLGQVAGTLTSVDCGASTLIVARRNGERVAVRLDENTRLQKVRGTLLNCADLSAGGQVRVHGRLLRRTGLAVPVLFADIVVLQGSGHMNDLAVASEQSVSGNVLSLVCAAADDGRLRLMASDGGVTAFTVDAETEWYDETGAPGGCADISAGAPVRILALESARPASTTPTAREVRLIR